MPADRPTRAMPDVKILSGVPGSGKSRLARRLVADVEALYGPGRAKIFSADALFTAPDGRYFFESRRLDEVHAACLRDFLQTLFAPGGHVLLIVDNTNLTAAEAAPYYRSAVAMGCPVEVVRLHAENPLACWRRNTHGVPLPVFLDMARRASLDKFPLFWNVSHHLVEAS